MPRLSLWKDGKHSNDYKFIDRRISEQFTVGGTSVMIHKYIGPQNTNVSKTLTQSQTTANTIVVNNTANISVGQWVLGTGINVDTKIGSITGNVITLTKDTTTPLTANSQVWISAVNDSTQPNYTDTAATNIQDLLLLENRDRNYEPDVYEIRGIYNVQDLDFDLSQFGLFLQNDILFITFHLNDMVERLGRKIMSGDVIELPHLKDYYSLDETLAVALKRFYVVKDAIRSSEGFSPTWWPHLWRIKVAPLTDSQEYRQILNQIIGTTTTGANVTLGNTLSMGSVYTQINDAILQQAERELPKSGYDTTPYWIPPFKDGNKLNEPLPPDSSPTETFGGYLVDDGMPANGYPVQTGIQFPINPANGDYFLRLDFKPNRLFRWSGSRWVRMEDNVRTSLTPGAGETLKDTFINNNTTFVDDQGNTQQSRQSLSKLLTPESDL